MTPSNALAQAMMNLLAADANTLAPAADAMKVKLVASSFVPSRGLTIGSLTLATFNGSTPLEPVLGAQEVGYDPVRGERFVQIIPPEGGWYWECAVAPGAAETIYGVILTDDAGTALHGSALLDTPVIVQSVGDSVYLPVLRFYESDLLTA